MRPIDTDVLRSVAGSLGIGNPATVTSAVDFDDGVLQQVYDVMPLVRRGGTPAGHTGLYWGQWEQAHAGAGQITTTTDPYDLAAPLAGFPSPIPDPFDVWVLGAQGAAATGVLSNARVSIRHPATAVAFDTGGAGGTFEQLVAYWDTDAVVGGGAVAYFADAEGIPVYRGPALRMPRGSILVANSQATGAGDITLQVLLGLFPAGLGQDGRAL